MGIVKIVKQFVEWLKIIKETRETSKILTTKGYALFSGIVGLTFGIVVGLIALAMQLASQDVNQSILFKVITGIAIMGLLAYAIWISYPMMIERTESLMTKLLTAFVVLILTTAGFMLGVYGIMLILVVVIAYFVLKIALLFFDSK